MFGATKRLGTKLSDALTKRARYYFDEASKSTGQTKSNQMLIAVTLSELSQVIRDVTVTEEE